MDSFFLRGDNSYKLTNAIYGILQLLLLFYILYKAYQLRKFKDIDLIKSLGMIPIIINSFAIQKNIIGYFMTRNDFTDYSILNSIGFFIVVIFFAILIKIGYFKKWDDVKFKIFDKNHDVEMNENMKVLFYISSTFFYLYGIYWINSSDIWYEQLIFTIATIVIALIQTYNIVIKKNSKESLSEIWIGLKYLILTWTLLNSFLSLEINSVLYSISGLIIAIASISFGFKFRFKSLRLYGLILTIIMVAKFILVDLSQKNSITRVAALVIGGLICFGISVIYNMLNTKIDE